MKLIKLFQFLILNLFVFSCGTIVGLNGFPGLEKDKHNKNLMLGLVIAASQFQVIDQYPNDTASNISTNPNIFVKLSGAVDENTLTSSNIHLVDGTTETPFTIRMDDPNSFYIKPNQFLEVNKSYHVRLDSGVTDLIGRNLANAYEWTFTTFNTDPDSGSVTTLAGSGTAGNTNATGTAASFNGPQGLTMNIAETSLFVADTNNHRIRSIVISNGSVSTVAGSTQGFATGTGVAARFNYPKGIFRIASNLFYISDAGNNMIRRMTSAYVVSNTYGSNNSTGGFVISTSTSAQRYRSPEGFAADFLSGSQYAVDTLNHCIRKTSVTGTGGSTSAPNTSCFAGASPSGGFGTAGFVDGTLNAARLNSPKGIAIDKVGNLYITDTGNHSIRMITVAGVVTTIAGNGSSGYNNGTGSQALFNSPTGITIKGSGELYVTDSGNCAIRKLVLDSTKTSAYVTTYAGATPDITNSACDNVSGTRLTSRFNNPTGIWIATNGILYVADTGNHLIRMISD